MRAPIIAGVLAACALAGAGCGGAVTAAGPGGTAAVTVHHHRSAALPTKAEIAKLKATPAPKRIVKPVRGAVHRTVASVRARDTEHGPNESPRTSGAGTPQACGLVTAAEARAILGRRATPTPSPLAPACVYRTAGQRLDVAVMVLTGRRFTPPRGRAAALVQTRLGRRVAYCVKGNTTSVPLGGGRLLRIEGACPIAARFAARALARVG
jgi:hypothetical protein